MALRPGGASFTSVPASHIESHDGAAYIEVMIPNEESQPMPEETIESGYKLKTPEVG